MSIDYMDKKHLLPRSDETDLLKEAIERQEYKNRGGKISCGHDFWDKDTEFGDVIFCRRCKQFFVKMKVLPWISQSKYTHSGEVLSTNHCEGVWYAPVEPRITKNDYSYIGSNREKTKLSRKR